MSKYVHQYGSGSTLALSFFNVYTHRVSIENKGVIRLSPEFILLGYLYQGPMHGYELSKRLAEEFGRIWRISQSQTYNILKRLVAKGYITSTEVDQPRLPARQLLRLTDTGISRFTTWLNTPTRCSVHAIRVEFITRLYFLQKYFPANIPEAILIQLEEVKSGIERLQASRESLTPDQTINRLALELRLQLLNSVKIWLDDCREKLAPTETQGERD